MRVHAAGGTDPGLEREENEDSVLVWRDRAGLDALLVVCDGLGGHAAGHEASTMAIETFTAFLDGDGKAGPDPERFKAALVEANQTVFEAARSHHGWAGMASTVVAVGIQGDELALLNVGDSPAYLVRDGRAELIIQDHSWPAEQARLGLIKPEEVENHPMKHRLTRAVGIFEQVAPYTTTMEIKEGDAVVLCSDGVETAGVSVDEMVRLLYGNDLKAGIQRVIDACRDKGAPDNVTVAVAKLEAGERRTQILKSPALTN